MKRNWQYHNVVYQLHLTTCAQCRTSPARFDACKERRRLLAVANRSLRRATGKAVAV